MTSGSGRSTELGAAMKRAASSVQGRAGGDSPLSGLLGPSTPLGVGDDVGARGSVRLRDGVRRTDSIILVRAMTACRALYHRRPLVRYPMRHRSAKIKEWHSNDMAQSSIDHELFDYGVTAEGTQRQLRALGAPLANAQVSAGKQ